MTEQRSLTQGLKIKVVDPDDDYLGIEIRAVGGRFAGAARIYAGLDELSEFANRIMGFPADIQDERTYEFGSCDPSVAGGYCRLHFQCVDGAGHAAVAIAIEDDSRLNPPGQAELILPIEPADLDRFVASLYEVEKERTGEAVLIATRESEARPSWWRSLSARRVIKDPEKHSNNPERTS